MSLAEREYAHELKGSDTEEFDEESFTTHMSLLSMSYTGNEEYENIDELGALGGIDELGAFGGIGELGTAGGIDELGAVGGIGELGTAGGIDEFGAVGRMGEMEGFECSWITESEEGYSRRRRYHKTKLESKEFEEHEGTLKEIQGVELMKNQLQEKESEQRSTFSVYEVPYESSIEIDKDELEVFVDSINKTNALLPSFNVLLIQLYLEAGISGQERISKLNEEYPLNRSKKIDFKNLRSPFGTEVKCLKDLDEEQLNDALFFDDFFVCSLSNFLKETKVGKFLLAEVCLFYKVGSIRFIPCNLELMKYLNSLFPSFDVEYFLYKNMGVYLARHRGYFWKFDDGKIDLIHRNTIKDNLFLEKLKIYKTTRELSHEETRKLRKAFHNANMNASRMRKLLKVYEARVYKIQEDLSTLLQFFPINIKYIPRDELIVTCIHYILSFCVQLIKPLYDKAQCNAYIEYDTFSNSSRSLNELLNHLEMLEFNSELYNIFCLRYPEFDKYYPRLNSFEEIISVYNYLVVKLQSVVVIFDISKFLLKLYSSLDVIKDYKENAFVLYTKILSDTEVVLRDAEELIKELT
ncbi:KELT protein [Plasmodium ovale curtisi]|nr:KELT protein [Plasmodium ovale curtisi]SBS99541.1 KELT protein [Plasmodium ovale curtisi]